MVSFRRFLQDTAFLQTLVGDWCKSRIESVLPLHKLQDNRPSPSNQTSCHQLIKNRTFTNESLNEIKYHEVSISSILNKNNEILLGQGSILHGLVWTLFPGHFSPPDDGGGLVQVRVLVCSLPPHETGHSLQSSHSDQLPSTNEAIEYTGKEKCLSWVHGLYHTIKLCLFAVVGPCRCFCVSWPSSCGYDCFGWDINIQGFFLLTHGRTRGGEWTGCGVVDAIPPHPTTIRFNFG